MNVHFLLAFAIDAWWDGRHGAAEFEGVSTSDAILVVAESICAESGLNNLQLSAVAARLNIEPPSVYRHYAGLNGITTALARLALQQVIATFDDLDSDDFKLAFLQLAENTFDLFSSRMGLTRLLLSDFSTPGGLAEFDNDDSLQLFSDLMSLESQMLKRAVKAGAFKGYNALSFHSARMGIAVISLATSTIPYPGTRTTSQKQRAQYLTTMNKLI